MSKRVIRIRDVQEHMVETLLNGHVKGTTCYIDEIDQVWTWRQGEVNIWTGYNNEGKGTMIRFLALIKALEEKKKFVFYAPEDSPAEWFYDEIIHTLSGKSTDKDNPNFIGPDLYVKCLEILKDLFIFIHIPLPDNTIENLVKLWRGMKEKDPSLYGFIIDPHIRITRSKESPDRDDLFGGYFMGYLNDFVVDFPDVSVHLVMHQQTPKKDDTGNYPEPSKYTIKQGGTYSDTADNVIIVCRPNYAKDKTDTYVIFKSEKIKKQKLVGLPGTVKMRFNPKTNRYVDYNNGSTDLYPFEKHLK
jgi:twinkle protein